jgi:hypothetical protein
LLSRDDDIQLARTSLVLLGGDVAAGRKLVLHKPGATHKPRFMAFGIYGTMMYSFFDQLKDKNEVEAAL